MATLRVGNAPCSWGTLEFDEAKGEQIGFARMLDELAETGYTGTELGDWGYMPTDPAALRAELARRGLVMLGAFVPVALKERAAHDAGVANAVKTARLLAAVATDPKPYLVLADDNGSVPERTRNAGRITAGMGLSAAEWDVFAEGANLVARAVLRRDRAAHGVPSSLRRLRRDARRDRAVSGTDRPADGRPGVRHRALRLRGGELRRGRRRWSASASASGTSTSRTASRRWRSRARAEQWDYFQALRHGVFCELGKGGVDFPALLRLAESARLRRLRAGGAGRAARHGRAERERAAQPRIPALDREHYC